MRSQGPLGPNVASSMACKQYKPYSSNQDQLCTNAFPTMEIPTTSWADSPTINYSLPPSHSTHFWQNNPYNITLKRLSTGSLLMVTQNCKICIPVDSDWLKNNVKINL